VVTALRQQHAWLGIGVLIACLALIVTSCSEASESTSAGRASSSFAESTTSVRSSVPPTPGLPAQPLIPSTIEPASSSGDEAGAPVATAERVPSLDEFAIDDGPRSIPPYLREDWGDWKDVDGDGCDARNQALLASSSETAQIVEDCAVVSGSWTSDYDGRAVSDPSDLDVDHVVPLENVHESGGWTWTADQRVQFFNDQANLWPVSLESNRSKGARTPDEWRPPIREAWCTYARRWISIKVRWQLTVTTRERDALGQMLDSCAP